MLPLLLLPGMMCDARLFGPQIAAFGGARAIHVAALGGHDSMSALAAEVLAHAPPRFALAGLSMGGIVAMEIIAQAPHRIARLALLDTNPLADQPESQKRREAQIVNVEQGRLRTVMRDDLKPNYVHDGPQKARVLSLCMTMAMDLGPAIFAAQSRALRDRPDRRETLRGVRVPTLVLCGREDRLCPPERHEMMHALISGSRLEIIKGAGHLPTLECPDETTLALRRWLED